MTFFTFAKSVILLTSFGYFTNGFHISSNPTRMTRIFSNSHPKESNDVPRNSQKADLRTLGKAINIVAAGLTVGSLSAISSSAAADIKPKIRLEPLPYDYKSLSPYISDKTLMTHHDKHHAKYVSTTLAMIKGTDMEDADLVSVMKNARVIAPVLFNNAAQSWNHDFYWKCMKKDGGGAPTGNMAAVIDKNFGSYENFKTQV
jgi:Iron/manganese superoxide dismutases, alpha-hairpin domain